MAFLFRCFFEVLLSPFIVDPGGGLRARGPGCGRRRSGPSRGWSALWTRGCPGHGVVMVVVVVVLVVVVLAVVIVVVVVFLSLLSSSSSSSSSFFCCFGCCCWLRSRLWFLLLLLYCLPLFPAAPSWHLGARVGVGFRYLFKIVEKAGRWGKYERHIRLKVLHQYLSFLKFQTRRWGSYLVVEFFYSLCYTPPMSTPTVSVTRAPRVDANSHSWA